MKFFLCKINKNLTFENLKSWYNGYKSYNGEKIFNTWSVIHALNSNIIENYWSQTGNFNEVKRMINYDIVGVKEDILEMINGNEIEIKLENYGVEDIRKESEDNEHIKEILYSKMEEFIKALNDKESDMQHFYNMIKNSDEMLEVTLHKNVKRMCEILDISPMEKISPGDRVDHGNLKRFIDYLYFNARTKYNIEEESPCGHGRVDIIFLNGEIIIIELKVNSTAKEAIKQIHQKKYYNGLKKKGYYGNILLIGINYDQKKVKYSCVIEEYNNNMKLLLTSESGAERKRRNELEFDGQYKRLRSSRRVLITVFYDFDDNLWLSFLKNKNKTSWDNLCGCHINTDAISGIPLLEKTAAFLNEIIKFKNTVIRRANIKKKKTVKQARSRGVHITIYVHTTKRNRNSSLEKLKEDIEIIYHNSEISNEYGIVPITKDFSESTINRFMEYIILYNKKYNQYFGFTEQVFLELYLEHRHNGYKAYYNHLKLFYQIRVDNIQNELKINLVDDF
ncbi:hypothetical protein H8356DRAFT_1331038 [Neocallimastix lanati (nom. inval.)]|nr:hypothetical protein H8356DRAFT_1331038 [Neocallimastix sp. JGI-2020a]